MIATNEGNVGKELINSYVSVIVTGVIFQTMIINVFPN